MDTKLKDYEPKYQLIEFLIENEKGIIIKGVYSFNKLIKKYGEYTICSVKNYDDTHSTSIIVRR